MRHFQQETEQTKTMVAKAVVIAESAGQKLFVLEKKVQELEKIPLTQGQSIEQPQPQQAQMTEQCRGQIRTACGTLWEEKEATRSSLQAYDRGVASWSKKNNGEKRKQNLMRR